MEIVVYSIMLFILGICFGSFFNVVGYRLPNNMSLAFPPSHCTNCNHKLGALELIPIFSYIFQGGKCKHCKEKISVFYPIFEFITGIITKNTEKVYSMACIITPFKLLSFSLAILSV